MSTYTVTVTREADAWLAQCDQEGYSGCVLGHFREAI